MEDLPARYHEYLGRFTTEIGDTKVGAFAKFNGRLIKKMTFEEFTPAWVEFTEMLARYNESIERGDTINDVVLRILREKASSFVLKPPAGG